MPIDYSAHRRAIERLYTDVVDIYRYENVKDTNTGVTRKEAILKYEKQPCRISQRALAATNQTEAQNNINYEPKLFISPELVLTQGDLVRAARGSVERRYEAGEPFIYPTHQEALLQRRDWA